MAKLGATAQKVLREYSKAVAHMKRQRDDGRFGLVCGSGVSKPLGFPDWRQFVKRVAKHPDVDGLGILNAKPHDPQASRTQVLFQHFRSREYEREGASATNTRLLEQRIRRRWREIVHRCLYEKVDTTKKISDAHP